MNNLIIIGNGFDLAHGLETSYENFVKYLIDSNTSTVKHLNIFQSNIQYSYDDLKNKHKSNCNILIEQAPITNIFIKELLRKSFLKNWCDIEELYYDILLNVGNQFSLHKKPIELNKEFGEVKNVLVEYLSTQEGKSSPINCYSKVLKTLDSSKTLILNFNYTNTLKRFYSDSLKSSTIIHMHGELNNEVNPIVFGYAAIDSESRELVGKKDNEYMRNIKKHLYKHTKNESLLSAYLSGTKKIDVLILGHSCGLSDKLILNQILNNENVETIRTFYFENYEHYFNTIVNVDRIMNEDEKFRNRIVDFNSSHRMPQFNDTDAQKKSFNEYIDKVQKIQFKQRPKAPIIRF